jgi:hypothetical protein
MNALEIHPNDAYLHHLLGRFRYEVANLSWIERKVLDFNRVILNILRIINFVINFGFTSLIQSHP